VSDVAAHEKCSLLLGCGNRRDRRIGLPGDEPEWGLLITLDIDPATGCDVQHDLNVLPYPFWSNQFDEIAAYEVLEHCGTQGDWRFFFGQFDELHRILKPGGMLFATVPSLASPWAWGDPGHTRVIPPAMLGFLDRSEYEKQVGHTPMTDYRAVYRGDFEIVASEDDGNGHRFALRARKQE